jgi:hypothetical protein
VVTWFTFLPSFIFILAGGPLVESTHGKAAFHRAAVAITAAVVGVIMQQNRLVVAVLLSVALHALGIVALDHGGLDSKQPSRSGPTGGTRGPPAGDADATHCSCRGFLRQIAPNRSVGQAPTPKPAPAPATALQAARETVAQPPPAARPQALMDAPPAPTAQEWAQAGTYTLKNSKRYRYTWGQQVRSMMGTAIEGPDQGVVRFRVEDRAQRDIGAAGDLVDHVSGCRATGPQSHRQHAAAAADADRQAPDLRDHDFVSTL